MGNRAALFLCVHGDDDATSAAVVFCRQLKTNSVRKWNRIRGRNTDASFNSQDELSPPYSVEFTPQVCLISEYYCLGHGILATSRREFCSASCNLLSCPNFHSDFLRRLSHNDAVFVAASPSSTFGEVLFYLRSSISREQTSPPPKKHPAASRLETEDESMVHFFPLVRSPF